MTEIWLDIPDKVGSYEASNLGRVRSVTRSITQIGRGGKPFTRVVQGRVLRAGAYCKAGHVSVVLGKGTNGRPVHQLILQAFVGYPSEGQEARHLDGNCKNNRLDNLVYGTRKENVQDMYTHGTGKGKVTRQLASEIKQMFSEGKTGASIARTYGLTQVCVSKIKRGVGVW